jgi:hypothetical protein
MTRLPKYYFNAFQASKCKIIYSKIQAGNFRQGQEISLYSTASRLALGLTQPLTQW